MKQTSVRLIIIVIVNSYPKLDKKVLFSLKEIYSNIPENIGKVKAVANAEINFTAGL
ncbi:hypothetical protein [Paenibacillus sp. 453mf]|uniref:hypothetical protein n=1 Tax=Paenibacillus sp. 453mf TaxID=1761874 RepID=UPI00147A0A06|nr:hypothetical protein [Paenibacillus sp. 453mf]